MLCGTWVRGYKEADPGPPSTARTAPHRVGPGVTAPHALAMRREWLGIRQAGDDLQHASPGLPEPFALANLEPHESH